MDFKLAVTGTVSVPDDGIEFLKETMSEVLQRALSAVVGVTPEAFYLQLGQGTEVNVRTVAADSPPEYIAPADGSRTRRAGMWED